ncbi:MAG: putative DNA binding domain-containing protein [Eubacterium sp.]|nr:putative DNA binding domain-containing protein [Eubacterium sp.]
MDIKQLIGETTEYDKKEKLEARRPKSWCKSISAFANSFGGTLVFGVTNDDEFEGIPEAEKDAELISELIKAHLNPIPDFVLSFKKMDDKKFILVEVKAGNQTPYYYEGNGQLIAFVRVGNESVPADSTKLRELVLKGSGETYDALKSKYEFSNMAFTKLKSVYKQRTGNSFENSDFESFGLIDENGNLTNAGALLADESPVRHSRLFCTRWNGLDKAAGVMDAIDDKEYSGSLITLLQSGIEFVTNNSKKAWMKTSDSRIEMPDYPERAVMEGIVNALIHRSYLEVGSEVHIDMFDDRIEIYSPGGMVSGISLIDKDIMKIPSKRRNPVLADIFNRLKYMERRGSGFKKIMMDYQEQPNYTEKRKPLFETDNDDFLLTLFNMNYESEDVTQDVGQDVGQGKYLNRIVQLIKINNKITKADIAKEIGVSEKTIEREMKKTDKVIYVGSGYSGHWEIKE